MKNLEDLCLNKLNKLLSNFDLHVDKQIVEYQIKYILIDIQIKHNISVYKSINEMLFSSLSIFYDLSNCKSCASFFISNFNISFPNIIRRCQRYINAYNNVKNLENSGSLEELIMKMDLMEI